MTTRWNDLAELVRWGVARDAGRPYLTWYDDTTGDRVELSYATFDNWVAKTAGLLRDGLDVATGDVVAVLAPPHWQTMTTLYGAWVAGVHAAVVTEVDELPALKPSVVVVDEPLLPDVVARRADLGRAHVVGVALGGLPRPLHDVPAGVVDLADELPPHPDSFVPFERADLAAPALTAGSATMSGRELVDAAMMLAATWELGPTDRALVVVDGRSLGDLAPFSLAVFVGGGGLVACHGLQPDRLVDRCRAEHVTVADAPAGWLDDAAIRDELREVRGLGGLAPRG